MPYSSNPLPIEFWTRFEVRLAAEYQAGRARLDAALVSSPVTVDTGDVALQGAPQARAAVFAQIRELEDMQLLLFLLGGQVRKAMYRAEIPEVEAHIACMRTIATLFSEVLLNQPRRMPREQEIHSMLSQYAALRNAGTGELTMSERARLRGMTVELPVIGAEDAVDHERALRSMQSSIDQQDAHLQHLRVNTRMSLQVPDELTALVQSFGVDMWEIQAPGMVASDEGAEAGEEQLAQAANPIASE